jgi:MOSC domain-containing protein YiiM
MELFSINLGQARPIQNAKRVGKTGIYKRPVSEPVQITASGLTGDSICDIEHHGGVDQAVYVYGLPDYRWWSEALGRELAPGTFGENLTITELETAQVYIGDRLQIGSVILEVTYPRIPCVTLAVRMEDPAFAKRFRDAERPGLYCRVIKEGYVQVGDPVTLERYAGETLPAIELFRDYFDPNVSEATIRRHLAAPIAVYARYEEEQKLLKLLAKQS